MANDLFGPKLAIFVDVVQAVYSYGACVGYLVIVGNEMLVRMSDECNEWHAVCW